MTEQEKQEILNAIKAESQSVDELETVNTLDNVNSLPAMQGTKVVKVPIALLAKPATDAAANANQAALNASNAESNAGRAAAWADEAGAAAKEAAGKANDAVEEFNTLRNEFEAAMGAIPSYYYVVMDANADNLTSAGCYYCNSRATGGAIGYFLIVCTRTGYSGGRVAIVQYRFNRDSFMKREGWESDTETTWGEWEEAGGAGTGSGFFNVTTECPRESGYYTLAEAVAAINGVSSLKDEAKSAMIMTFEESQGKWVDYRFVGTSLDTFDAASSWERYGGGDAIKELRVNGVVQKKDATGRVDLTIDKIEIDESLDAESTNPIQNSAVTAKLNDVEANTIFGANAELSEDESSVRLSLTNKSGAEIVAVDLPAGSGGGGGETQTTKIVLNASVSNDTIKEGGSSVLTYSYDHQNVGGDDAGSSTGQKANIQITLKRGSNTVYTDTLKEVSAGTYQLDMSKYLFVGTTDVYVKASVTDPNTGKQQVKQSYVSVKVVTLSLSSSYNLAQNLSAGGYGTNDTVTIPFAVSGSGTKVVTLYVDGVQTDIRTVTKSGTSNGSFSISMSGKSVGRHNIQMVAEMEASAELTLRSESIYIDILKRGSNVPYIGTMFASADGTIQQGASYKTPHIAVGQYEQMSLSFVVYDATVTPAQMNVLRDGVQTQSVSVPRNIQTYNNRFTDKGKVNMLFRSGATDYPFVIDVQDSGIEINEAEYGLQMKLSATGRSNEESTPGTWTNGDVTTSFEGFDWKSSGWTGSSLRLINGAKINIGYTPFKTDAATNGGTIELEYKVSNIRDREMTIISCLSGNKGFQITGEKASMYTGSTKQVTDEDGETTTEPVGVSRQYGEDMWIKAAFVIGKRAEGRKMELYVNGTRSAADIYSEGDNFLQESPVGITVESDGADVELRNVRVYNRALSDDEEVDNHIVDSQTVEQMIQLFDENDVLNDDGTGIDFEKLHQKGKALMLVIRPGGLAPVNAENNKKADFLSDVHLWMPDGRYIYMHNVYIRIQGTSSTKYPSKNYRIYCAKGESPELWINGVLQDTNKFELRIGQKEVKIFCAKADYSDSSMVQNTGGSKIYNRMMKALGFLTPPQQHDASVRIGIDGFPIDVFSAESMEENPTYAGQYNFNHDKSDWYDIIGLQGVDGFEPECPIAFEFLNNTEPLCLFQSQPDLDAQAAAQFDNAIEFNYPKDTTWGNASLAQKQAFKDLWGWVRDCVPSGADPDNIDSFASAKFKSEVGNHIDLNFLLCWYLFTDFHVMVDQRAKNMIWITWDGKKWYLIYYDGDTQIGDRNDSFLKYLYNVTRDTWDAEKSKYAFEGHDSYIWCLLLANFKEELKAMATKMRSVLTPDMVNDVFDNEQQSNWSARAYNKSGELKYIKPQIDGVMVGGENVKYPYIYALKGDKQSFRHWFIKNRYALLDAKYETGNYLSDNIDMYMSRTATEAANTINVTSNELYYFGYGTNNAPHLQESVEAQKGEIVKLTFAKAFTVNDPLRLYGASRMAELDMRGAANNITGDINLNKCSVLRKLNLSTTGLGSNGWCLVLDQCRQLTEINLNGQKVARTGTLSSTELNFSNQTKLQRLDAGGVNVDGIVLAEGAPVTYVRMGNNIKTLRLEYLPQLETSGLLIGSFSNIETFRFTACPKLNCWSLLEKCSNVKRIRITGVDAEGDGSLLAKYMNVGGVDVDGNATDTCALVGTYKLTKYLSDDVYNKYVAHYPELNIVQPQYTMLEFDDAVSDDANVSNLDNQTGYKYANSYAMSGHLNKIFSQRHRVLGKQTVKGTMTICQLHDNNSNYYADAEVVAAASPAKLDGTEGDAFMYEPHFWFKGINDYLNQKKYSCYSSNATMPDKPEATVLSYDDILSAGNVKANYKVLSGKTNLQTSYTADSNYSVCRVRVDGYKKVRFPTVPGTGLIASVFTDDSGTIIDTMVVSTIIGKFEPGMYLIADVPEGGTWINFTIAKTAEFDCVVLSNSDRIEDMEPDWVEHKECLVGLFETTIVGEKFRSVVSGGQSTANMTWTDFNFYSAARGMQQIDYDIHRDIANLVYARYGRRDVQTQCGAGYHSYTRTTGGTVSHGMTDTIGYDEAYTINPNITKSFVDNINPQYAWYKEIDEYGSIIVRQVNNTCCLGYEDIYGDKYEMMDKVKVNIGSVDYKWIITMPDGQIRKVKGSSTNGLWITGVVHGKYMDIIPAGSRTGSNSTFYCDMFYISGSTSRVVYRGYNNANSNGGVSNANASYDASYSNANVGSRLAFRGIIVWAQSVSAYKALTEVA